jgi:hypothetical protein
MAKRFWLITFNLNSWIGLRPDQRADDDGVDFVDEHIEFSDKIKLFYKEVDAVYLVWSIEIGSTGNLHVHCYVEFKHCVSLQFLIDHMEAVGLPHGDCEWRRGSKDDVVNYVKKEGLYDEFGVPVEEEVLGLKRAAIEYLKEHSYSELLKEDLYGATLLPSTTIKDFERNREVATRHNDGFCEVRWFFGDPGSGKSYQAERWVSNNYEQNYNFKQGDKKFFVSWDYKCRNIFIDNVTLHYHELEDIIGIAGEAPYTVEVKGESHFVHCNKVAITSVRSPYDLFYSLDEKERRGHDWREIERRIDSLILCVKGQDGSHDYVDVAVDWTAENKDMNNM